MKQFQSIIGALFTALLSTVIVFGAFSLSSNEEQLRYTATLLPTTPEPVQMDAPANPTSTLESVINTPFVQVITPSFTPTLINTSAICPPPENWVPYTIQVGDSLETLAQQMNISPEVLKAGNCLEIDSLIPGSIIYLPKPQETATFTPTTTTTNESTSCGPPPNWVLYTVQSEDTLFELSIIFGVSIADLQEANCMGNSTLIKTGQQIYVPFILAITPTHTPTLYTLSPTATLIITTTIAPTRTNTPVIIYTATPTPSSTFTLVWTPTSAFTPTSTYTVVIPTSTNTAIPSNTPTITQTPTPTNTPIPGSTSTETPTLTPKP